MDKLAHHVVARMRDPLFKIGLEQRVQEAVRVGLDLEILLAKLGRRGAQRLDQHVAILMRNPEQIADHQGRHCVGIVFGDLAAAAVDKPIDQPVRKAEQIVLILPEPAVGQQLGEQGPLGDMRGAVMADEMLGPGQCVAVAGELPADVVSLRGEGQRRDRPGDGQAGREILTLVAEHVDRLRIAGDHHDIMMRLAIDRAAPAQLVHIGGHILVHLGLGEKIGELPVTSRVGHGSTFSSGTPSSS